MATAAVDNGILDNAVSDKVDSPENPKGMADPTPGAAMPMDSVNGLPKVQESGSEVVDSNLNKLSQGVAQDDEEEEPADIKTQQKSLESEVNERNISREAEKAFLDLFADIDRKLDQTRNPLPLAAGHSYILNREADMPLEWRIKNVKKLSFVLHAYFRLMEDRIAFLEEGRGSKAKGDESSKETAAVASKTIAVLKRMTWAEFKREHEEKRNANEEYAIDVLVGDPVIPHDIWRNRKNLMRLGDLHRYAALKMFTNIQDKPELTGQAGAKSSEILHEAYPSIPDRIRINGGPLSQLLEKALEVEFKSSNCSVVLLKPYKLLVQHETRIRQIYEQLKHKFANKDAQKDEVAVKDQKNQDILDTHGTEQAFKELCCLIEFMDSDLKILKQLRDASVTKVRFSDLWHVFYPGCEVITSQGPVNAYRVFYVTGGRFYLSPPEDDVGEGDRYKFTKPYRIPDKASDLTIACYQMDFDGNKFGPVSHSFTIQKYDDFRDITSLPIYPFKLAKKNTKIRDMLTTNGRTFLEVCKGEHVQYRGINLHETEEIDSEVVVDFHAALWDSQDKDKDSGWNYTVEFGIKPPTVGNKAEVVMVSSTGCRDPHCCENEVIFDDLTIDHQRMEDFLSDNPRLTIDLRYLDDTPKRIHKEDLILFPHRLFAFVLKDRKWAIIDINKVKRVPDPKTEAWKSLVLPPGHKDMVYSIVQAHFRDKKRLNPEDEIQTDLIRGKGKGLIILLHGAPGVGKTSTAECVAELCKRPLYPITCGDLGITAVEVESRLKRIFVQAQKWKCVLLLDEADVFLSERGNDVKHNSLVSVFLRILEYYQGILFLTTNRVGKIDEAFRSRVHISLYYPPLDLQQTVDIFKTNLERIKNQKGELLKTKDKAIEAFARDHYEFNKAHGRWNGRQIRNAFHIAVALAENEAMEKSAPSGSDGKPPRATLRTKHFQKVEGASTKFDDYLTSVLGMGQAERAREKSYRQDTWRQERDNREQYGNRRTRDKGANRRKPIEYDDSTSESTDSGEDGDEVEKRSESGESSGGKGRSRSESSDEEEDLEDDKRASRKHRSDAGKKRSRERDRGSRTKGRSKKST